MTEMSEKQVIPGLSQLILWDSFNPATDWSNPGRPDRPYIPLFMGKNATNQSRSNLPASAGVPPGEDHVVTNWYARTNIAPSTEFYAFASASMVELNVGAHSCQQILLSELLQLNAGWNYPAPLAIVPQRQNYDVCVTADRRAIAALLEVLPTNVAPETLVWVHLEGVRRRKDGDVVKDADR